MPRRIASINFFFENPQVDVVEVDGGLVEIQLARIHWGFVVMKHTRILCSGRRLPFFRPFSLLHDVVYANETAIHNAKCVTCHENNAREIRQSDVLQ